MDDVTRHPDDATLFDLVEETLEPARADIVRAHLARCAACAAFVQAARAGAPVTSSAVEAMPAEAAQRLHAAVSTAWRERVAGIAAAEAAQDAEPIATTPVPSPGGAFAGYAPAAGAADASVASPASAADAKPTRGPRRARRLVPILAFVVLGTLAGTSVLIGDETSQQASVERSDSTGDADRSAEPSSEAFEDVPPATDLQDPALESPAAGTASSAPEASADAAAGGGATPVEPGAVPAGEPQAGVEQPGVLEPVPDDGTDASKADGAAADESAAVPPPSGYDAFVDQDLVCIATLDQTQLSLPDGRIPTRITQGPLGLYLVCG